MTAVVLKHNRYKTVELVASPGGVNEVVKRFSGHAPEDLRRNTEHDWKALGLLADRFAGIVRSPRARSCDLDSFELRMEYLAELDAARGLSLATVGTTAEFFERCYAIDDDQGFLPSIAESIHANPAIRSLIADGFPMRLGFKGDLHANLLVGAGGLVLADVETMCIEPLGLSELALYIGLAAAPDALVGVPAVLGGRAAPVALRHLQEADARRVFEAALALCERGMSDLPAVVRAVKLAMVRGAWAAIERTWFGRHRAAAR